MLPDVKNPPLVACIFLAPRNIVKIGKRLRNAPLPLNIVMNPAACLNIMVRPLMTSFMIGRMSKNAFFNFWLKSEIPDISSPILLPNSRTSSSFSSNPSLKPFMLSIPPCFIAAQIGENAFSKTRAPSIIGRMKSTIFFQPFVNEFHQLLVLLKNPCVLGSHF